MVSTLAFFTSHCGVNKPPEIAQAEKNIPELIDYNLHVKPILSDRCFACHGPDQNKQKAGLRLDTPEGALAALSSGKTAIVPNNLRKSEVYHRIISQDSEYKMPPVESNLSLNPEEIAILTRWIEQGAIYKPHWAFIPPQKSKLPPVKNTRWPRNEIDHFVLARLEKEQISPAPEADKETLIRRLSLDLTGLPPTLAEVNAFIKDQSPQAYEKVVDRLLASPHYGERLATEWLDLARYADTHGYQDDGMRNVWPWRDWVIAAFNRNLSYKKFVSWQLAGDMLPNPTQEQILATAFNRNHPQTQEGGVVPEEYRIEYVADRTNTTGKAFLGLTLECARCHDHKYDPISQKEYYQLFAFYNNVNETGQIPYVGEASPTLILTDEEAEKKLRFIQKEIKATKQQLAAYPYQAPFQQWLKSLSEANTPLPKHPEGLIGYFSLDKHTRLPEAKLTNLADPHHQARLAGDSADRPRPTPAKFGEGLELVGEGFISLGKELGKFERNEAFSISFWTKILNSKAQGPFFSRSGGIYNGFRGYDLLLQPNHTLSASLNHVWPDNSLEIHSKAKMPLGQWVHLGFSYDGSSQAEGIRLYLNGQPLAVKIKNNHLRRSILHYGPDKNNWGDMKGALNFGERYFGSLNYTILDEIKIFDRALTVPEVVQLADASRTLGDVLKAYAKNPVRSLTCCAITFTPRTKTTRLT
ncbi:MAG: DUF1549 domain-containing protein [Bacteroidia bacterium]|nr:DUF1549 domain-containing protein [Bacteroidia bacterium]